MDDDQKWLEAAAAIEQDIIYLKAAMADAKRNGIPLGLEQDILQLNVVLGIYRTNAHNGVAFPQPGRSILHQQSFLRHNTNGNGNASGL